jgi:hypothetical protein
MQYLHSEYQACDDRSQMKKTKRRSRKIFVGFHQGGDAHRSKEATTDQMSLVSELSAVLISHVILSFDRGERQCHINFVSGRYLRPLPNANQGVRRHIGT